MIDHMTIKELVLYLSELPEDLEVLVQLIEDNSFTVIVSPNGDARTIRNANNDHRLLIVDLPPRNS
jgi:hypothetical protein